VISGFTSAGLMMLLSASLAAAAVKTLEKWEKGVTMELVVDFEDCKKRLLRDLYFADSFHAFLALFLFFQQLALSRDVRHRSIWR